MLKFRDFFRWFRGSPVATHDIDPARRLYTWLVVVSLLATLPGMFALLTQLYTATAEATASNETAGVKAWNVKAMHFSGGDR